MKREDFIYAIKSVERKLNKCYYEYGRTDGLCRLLDDFINYNAKVKFNKLYRSKYGRGHYLAPLDTEKGLQTRIKYLHKFKRRMLWTFGYWEF